MLALQGTQLAYHAFYLFPSSSDVNDADTARIGVDDKALPLSKGSQLPDLE